MLFFLFFSSLICEGQQSYIIDPRGNIFSIDIASGCSITLIYQCKKILTTDIAADFSGNIYVISEDSLFVVDTNNPGRGCIFLGIFSDGVNGLIVWKDGNVYASGTGLSKYDPLTRTFSYLGNFPPNIFSAGDLLEYNNKMYLSTSDGDIYEININDPKLSSLYFKVGVTSIFGMIVITTKCFNHPDLQQRVIAFEPTGVTSKAYLIDMENKIIFPDYCEPQVAIAGSTSKGIPEILGDPILINNISITNPTCNQVNNGMIYITMVLSQVNKYVFSADNKPETNMAVFNELDTGWHTFRVKNQFGCYIDTSINLPPENFICKDTLFIPSAFTPNQDGLNDFFRTKSILPVKNFELNIYNRYGQNIYTSYAINKGWDGKFRFVPQPPGIYIWMLRYTNYSGKNIFRKGLFTLIR